MYSEDVLIALSLSEEEETFMYKSTVAHTIQQVTHLSLHTLPSNASTHG